jgi:hypothetical protein
MLSRCHTPTLHPPRHHAVPKSAANPLYSALLLVLLTALASLSPAVAKEEAPTPSAASFPPAKLSRAVMCEDIQNYAPVNPAVVFPITIGKISCLSTFDPVAEKTFVYHDWYCRDKLCKKVKLDLKTPRWSTYSSIQLREEDKGPWHVIITDPDGKIYRILRFSITD